MHLGGRLEPRLQGDAFKWDVIWEEDCLTLLRRAYKSSNLMDKVPLKQVGNRLDAICKRTKQEKGVGIVENPAQENLPPLVILILIRRGGIFSWAGFSTTPTPMDSLSCWLWTLHHRLRHRRGFASWSC